MFLRELKKSVLDLHGVGKALYASYASIGICSQSDLLLHFPRSYEDRNSIIPLNRGIEGIPVNTIVQVTSHSFIGKGPKSTLKVTVADETGTGSLLCFGRNFLQDMLKVGREFYLYGSFTYRYHELQTSSFEVEPVLAGQPPKNFGSILPIYPLGGKLTHNIIRRDVSKLLTAAGRHIDNELPADLIEQRGLMDKSRALSQMHFPESLKIQKLARETLAYEELFHLQLVVRRRALKRQGQTRDRTNFTRGSQSPLGKKLIASLPFALTRDQLKVLSEIDKDLQAAKPMARLIQGDVGSGKTLTAFISALPVIESGGQAAFMAPTELLARQHAENAAKLLEPLGVRLAYLTGSLTPAKRSLIIQALKEGDIDLIIGTHALFSRDVEFRKLRYVIVDEQHRFGVLQRIALATKGETVDMLLMTATPIPRTLTMTVFGDLDVSTIKTMPPGRKPITTHLAAEKSRDRVYSAVGVEFQRGHQAYFVYPRIDDRGNSDLRDAESMFAYLSTKVYPGIPAGLIHSRIPEEEKLEIMDRFRTGELTYLVSTSVVEVGVDVPNAACMVIEHAERFGLSALHQLRGRVGRGDTQSYAFLIYSDALTDEGKERLMVMKESNDGFVIAERDLRLRGPGEIAGVRQSGFLKLTAADIILDHKLLSEARSKVDELLSSDPGLLHPGNRVLRELLQKAPPFEEELTEG